MKNLLFIILIGSVSCFAQSSYDFNCPKLGTDHVLKVNVSEGIVDETYEDEGQTVVFPFKAEYTEEIDGNVYFYGKGGLVFKLYKVSSEKPYIVDAIDEETNGDKAEKHSCYKEQ